MRNYELTNETMEYNGVTLHRIRATRDFVNQTNLIKVGTLGGWVQNEYNLQEEAWIYDEAKAYHHAVVTGSARLRDNAEAYDNSRVFNQSDIAGQAQVCDEAQVCDNAFVFGKARIMGSSEVCGNAIVGDNAVVTGETAIYDKAKIYGNAQVSGCAHVYDSAQVYGDSVVGDNSHVFGSAHIYGQARIVDMALVYDNARVSGDARIGHEATIRGEAIVENNNDWLYMVDDFILGNITVTRTSDKNKYSMSTRLFHGTLDYMQDLEESLSMIRHQLARWGITTGNNTANSTENNHATDEASSMIRNHLTHLGVENSVADNTIPHNMTHEEEAEYYLAKAREQTADYADDSLAWGNYYANMAMVHAMLANKKS